jgi:hypothetical protein
LLPLKPGQSGSVVQKTAESFLKGTKKPFMP